MRSAAFFFTKILKAIVITEWMCYTKINYTATVVTHSLERRGENGMSDDRHKKALDQAVQKLRTQFSNYVTAIYCYGSYARGEQKFWSDVDVLVKVSDDTSPRIMRQMRAEVIPEQYDLPEVDLKFSSGEEFSTSYRFNENIKKEGKLIWKKD